MINVREYRMGVPKKVTDKPLRVPKANTPLDLSTKLHRATLTQERRVIVTEAMGEMFYAFGNKRTPWKPWLTYEENMSCE